MKEKKKKEMSTLKENKKVRNRERKKLTYIKLFVFFEM